MKIIFRTDASSQIGNGHVIRCLTLAKVLRKQGVDCKFICRDHKNSLIKKIQREDFEVFTLSNPDEIKLIQNNKGKNLDYSSWLGASWKQDAKQTIDILKKEKIDWIVIDHYGIDIKWEEKLRPYSKKIMVIDDLSNRVHNCDLLLDQNLIANYKNRYQNLLPKNCSTLLGPKYALLQNEYKDLHLSAPTRTGSIKHILIYFGGTDLNNLTEIALSSFLKLDKKNLTLDIVINSNNPQKEKIKKLSKKNKNIKIYSELASLAPLILKADIAIGACGATSWERCCLGLPSIVITIADNQKPIARELHKQGLIRWLGHYDTIVNNSIYDELKTLINQKLEVWSNECKLITDGYGAEKVASILSLNSKTKLEPRLAKLKDISLIHDFHEFNNKYKSVEEFRGYFNLCLRNQDKCKVYILEICKDLPICRVQFDLTKDGWTIKCSQARFVRNLNLEKYFIERALCKFRLDQDGRIFFSRGVKSNKNIQKKLSISICSEKTSWINSSIPSLIFTWIDQGHSCSWVHDADHLIKGDLCFYLSYEKIVNRDIRKKFKHNLVVHASNLPKGKGWSPLSWQILEGSKNIKVTLIEAEDKVDSGKIYMQLSKKFEGYELLDELHSSLIDITLQLCCCFVDEYPKNLKKAKTQNDKETFYPRRFPKDSRLDLNKSIKKQFNLLRVVDNDRYPAFFEINGYKYYLFIKPDDNN